VPFLDTDTEITKENAFPASTAEGVAAATPTLNWAVAVMLG